MMDEYPTYEEWIKMFDMDTDTPDMVKLEPAHAGKLPVWAKGNAYFNGAKAWKKEENPLADTEHQVYVEINCQDGKPVLSTNLYEFMGDYFAGMVNSDLLGSAFEPEQRFENPDGTDIVFDRDTLGTPGSKSPAWPLCFCDGCGRGTLGGLPAPGMKKEKKNRCMKS